MSVFKWPVVKLKGESQLIPRTCPICLQPSTQEWRYSYVKPFPLSLLDRTRYWQTFYYCADCSRPMEAFFKLQAWSARLYILGVVLAFALLIGAAVQFGKTGPWREWGGSLPTEVVMGGAVAVAVLVIAVLRGLLSGAIRKGLPGHPGSTSWGPAVYFVGDGAMGLGDAQSKVYRVLRPEWLKALVELNPAQVDDQTFRQVTGADKPAGNSTKPFA